MNLSGRVRRIENAAPAAEGPCPSCGPEATAGHGSPLRVGVVIDLEDGSGFWCFCKVCCRVFLATRDGAGRWRTTAAGADDLLKS